MLLSNTPPVDEESIRLLGVSLWSVFLIGACWRIYENILKHWLDSIFRDFVFAGPKEFLETAIMAEAKYRETLPGRSLLRPFRMTSAAGAQPAHRCLILREYSCEDRLLIIGLGASCCIHEKSCERAT
jgi:hypothetical protein